MIRIDMTYKQLYDIFGNGEHEVPYNVNKGIFVQTPEGKAKINYVVCKHNNEIVRLDFSDGDKFECSINHLFSYNGAPLNANEVEFVDSIYGKKFVVEKTYLSEETVYDISIDSPHWYIANPESGIIHHNTYFALGMAKTFLDENPEGGVVYFDTESAVTKDMMESRGLDTSRILIQEPESLQEFRHKAIQILDRYTAQKESDRKPMFMILDSLGMLSSTKEIEDSASGSETRDMTKAQVTRAIFRVLRLKLAKANVAMIVTNHTYQVVGAYVPTKEMSGGGGLKFAADCISFLSKKKDRDGTDVVGNFITVNMHKSRFTKENSKVDVRLSYDKGLDRYYGLLELGEKAGIFKKVGNKYEFPNGEKAFEKAIYNNPEKWFTEEILDQLNQAAADTFLYGMGEDNSVVTEEESEE